MAGAHPPILDRSIRMHRDAPAAPAVTNQDPLWYKDAVIYQLHVKA